jgi:glycogen synthase
VAADTGGLRDAIAAGLAAASFEPDDTAGLVAALDAVLSEPTRSRRHARRAAERVRQQYSWAAIAERTVDVYRRAAGRSDL